jgi:hypothetical protein
MYWDLAIGVLYIYLGHQSLPAQVVHDSCCFIHRCISHMGEVAMKVVVDAEVVGGGQIYYDTELPWGLLGDDRQSAGDDMGAFVGR